MLVGSFFLVCSAARADCGGVHTVAPTKKRAQKLTGTNKAPLAIGDSTMLFALPPLRRAGFRVDAHGCRQLPEGFALLRRLHRRNAIPHLVVIALGADGSLSQHGIERILGLIGKRRVLALVVPLELGGGTGSDAEVVREAARRHRKRVKALDWPGYSSGHPSWFAPDHLHLTFAGARGFTSLLRQALHYARPGKFFS
jgi:hypothetical protein